MTSGIPQSIMIIIDIVTKIKSYINHYINESTRKEEEAGRNYQL